MFERLTSYLPSLPSLPKITSEAEIPVYMIHMDGGEDDYFFLFDFEVFAAQSKRGLFVRPKLRIWAGRDDFSRTEFALQFRQTFQAEFDRMRTASAAPKEEGGGWGWLSVGLGEGIGGFAANVVANLVLWMALSAGRTLTGLLQMPGWARGKSKEAAVEDEISTLKSQVDDALQRVDIALHPELYYHARSFGAPLASTRLEKSAWPLPGHVRDHVHDGSSGSWW